jgi:hypothetical protein
VVLTYNASDSVTNAKFYLGELPEERHVTFTADSGGSLNNTYFTLYAENDEALYHVWYNVSGGGVDPAPSDSCGIEIPIETNDAAAIVKLATQRCLEKFPDFAVKELAPDKLRIRNSRNGVATDTADVGTGFTITTDQQGTEKLIKSVDVPFDGKTRYIYNTQEKRFENFPITTTDVTISGEVDIQNPNTMEMINTTIALKNTEVSINLPDDTKRYEISIRNSAKVQLAFVAGQTNTNFRTIFAGNDWNSGDIDIPNSTTIYVRSNKDNTIIETTVWRRV